MISLKKLAKPSVLVDNEKAWTEALLTKMKTADGPTQADKLRYRHSDIKDALKEETGGKCAYCESRVVHVAPGDIEHVRPKSQKPELAFSWENLTIACPECNRRKNDEDFSESTMLVDPYVRNPDDFFWHQGAHMLPIPGNDAAFATWDVIGLDRDELYGSRREKVEALRVELDNIARCADPDVRKILISRIRSKAEASEQYSAMSKAFIEEGLRLVERVSLKA